MRPNRQDRGLPPCPYGGRSIRASLLIRRAYDQELNGEAALEGYQNSLKQAADGNACQGIIP